MEELSVYVLSSSEAVEDLSASVSTSSEEFSALEVAVVEPSGSAM